MDRAREEALLELMASRGTAAVVSLSSDDLDSRFWQIEADDPHGPEPPRAEDQCAANGRGVPLNDAVLDGSPDMGSLACKRLGLQLAGRVWRVP